MPDEAVRYLEPALAFYQQGGYRSEMSYCLALLARANLQKGDYAAAPKGTKNCCSLGSSGMTSRRLRWHTRSGDRALTREEKFTEALDHLNQAYFYLQLAGNPAQHGLQPGEPG